MATGIALDNLLMVFTILSGVVFFYALFIFQAAMSFWTVESLEIMNTLTYGGVETAQLGAGAAADLLRRVDVV